MQLESITLRGQLGTVQLTKDGTDVLMQFSSGCNTSGDPVRCHTAQVAANIIWMATHKYRGTNSDVYGVQCAIEGMFSN